MSATLSPSSAQPPSRVDRHDRAEVAALLEDFREHTGSVRDFVRQAGIPRSTFLHWLARQEALDEDPTLVAFFSSSAGLALLHRLVMATHLCLRFSGAAGERSVGQWLRLTRLDVFVASSAASHHLLAQEIDEALAAFEQVHDQRAKDHSAATPRPVHVGLDEMFRPTPILTVLDIPSGYVLEQTHAAHRDEATWTRTLKDVQDRLPVAYQQGVGDEAKGLVNALQNGLGVPHHTDVFHPQLDITRATAAALKAQVTEAQQHLARVDQQSEGVGPERQQAVGRLYDAEMVRGKMAEAVRALSEAMHPLDLKSGQAREPEQVEREMRQAVETMKELAEGARLRPRAREAIEKAERLVSKMAATVAWWQRQVVVWVMAAKWPSSVGEMVLTELLPTLYLELASERVSGSGERKTLRKKAEELAAVLQQPGHLWGQLDEACKQQALSVGRLCAAAFLRSSSSVEGQQGWVSLHGQGWHGLPPERLVSLRVLRNHLLKDGEERSAYERLFGLASGDVFEWLLERVELPSWPSAGKKGSRGSRSLLN